MMLSLPRNSSSRRKALIDDGYEKYLTFALRLNVIY